MSRVLSVGDGMLVGKPGAHPECDRSDVVGQLPGADQIEQSGEAFVEVFCAESAATFQTVLALMDEAGITEGAKVVGE